MAKKTTKTVAKKPAAKAATKKVVAKPAAKKAAAKPAAKKVAAKPAAKKVAAKPAAKKPAAKKPVAKKVAAKPAAKKPAAKPAAKKVAAKPAAKKPVEKKVAKKVATKAAPKKPVSKKKINEEKLTAPVKVQGPTKKNSNSKKPSKDTTTVEEAGSSSSSAVTDFAFRFAERRKMEQRAAEEKERASNTVKKPGHRPSVRQNGVNSEDAKKFPASTLEEFRKSLLKLRQKALGQSNTLKEGALETTDDRSSEDDDGTDVTMRLQNLNQVDFKAKSIQEIDEALRRIDNGTYGICEHCGLLIRKQRLLEVPMAKNCYECQQKLDKTW